MSTIPDAVSNDLRDLFLITIPAGLVDLTPDRVCLKIETGDIPSPRLVIVPGLPRHFPKMDGTARIQVSLEYITSLDRVQPADHESKVALIENWVRELGRTTRRSVIHAAAFLHELTPMQSVPSIRKEEREQVTAIRAEMVVTLVDLS